MRMLAVAGGILLALLFLVVLACFGPIVRALGLIMAGGMFVMLLISLVFGPA